MKKFIILSQLFLISTLLNYNFCYPVKKTDTLVATHLLGKLKKDQELHGRHITLQPTPEEQKKQAFDNIPLQISIKYLIDTLINQAKTFKNELDQMGLKAEDFESKNKALIKNFDAIDSTLQNLNLRIAVSSYDINTNLNELKEFFVTNLFGEIFGKYTKKVEVCISQYKETSDITTKNKAEQSVLNLASVSIGMYKIALKCVNPDAYTEETKAETKEPKKTKISLSTIKDLILTYKPAETNIEDIPLLSIIESLINILTDQTTKFTAALKAARESITSKFNAMLAILTSPLTTPKVKIPETKEKIELINGILAKFQNISSSTDTLIKDGQAQPKTEAQTYYPKSIEEYQEILRTIKDNFCENGIFNSILSYYIGHVCEIAKKIGSSEKEDLIHNKIEILTPLFDLLRCLFTIAEIAQQTIKGQAEASTYQAHNIGYSIVEFDYFLKYFSTYNEKTHEKKSSKSPIIERWKIFNVKNSVLRTLRSTVDPTKHYTRKSKYSSDEVSSFSTVLLEQHKKTLNLEATKAAKDLHKEILDLIAAEEKKVASQPEPPHPTPEPKTVSEPQPPAHPSPAVQPKQPIKKPAKKPVSHR